MKELTFIRAINEAVDEEMQRDPSVFILGEDVGKSWGAAAGDYRGLFGASGAAATGMRPIAFLFFVDFLGVCGDELINQLTQMRYMFGGKIKLPVTITAYIGAGTGSAAQHSKTLFGWLMSIPGISIVVPSTPYDAKGLLKSAIREDNPVIFLEQQRLLFSREKSEIPDGEYTIPLGKADIKREGTDVTVVATALMVHRALAAAVKLQEQGISIEVIDPRTLVPLDKQTIIDSVKKTGRLVIMSEEPKTGSAAGEIAAIVADEAFDFLDAPVKRVCAPDTPVPYSPVLEKFWMPDEENLIKAVTEIM
jgi:pyruvate dehydrogenase E1 component beta subunit